MKQNQSLSAMKNAMIYLSKENIPLFLGRNGSNVDDLEKKYSLRFEVKEKKSLKNVNDSDKETLRFSTDKTSNSITLNVQPGFEDKLITIYIDDDFFMSVKASKKGQIKMATTGAMGKILVDALNQDKKIRLMG